MTLLRRAKVLRLNIRSRPTSVIWALLGLNCWWLGGKIVIPYSHVCVLGLFSSLRHGSQALASDPSVRSCMAKWLSIR